MAVDREMFTPFEHGWRRQVVYRYHSCSTKRADVYYFKPGHKKLRSRKEVATFIQEHPDPNVNVNMFTFSGHEIGGAEGKETVKYARVAQANHNKTHAKSSNFVNVAGSTSSGKACHPKLGNVSTLSASASDQNKVFNLTKFNLGQPGCRRGRPSKKFNLIARKPLIKITPQNTRKCLVRKQLKKRLPPLPFVARQRRSPSVSSDDSDSSWSEKMLDDEIESMDVCDLDCPNDNGNSCLDVPNCICQDCGLFYHDMTVINNWQFGPPLGAPPTGSSQGKQCKHCKLRQKERELEPATSPATSPPVVDLCADDDDMLDVEQNANANLGNKLTPSFMENIPGVGTIKFTYSQKKALSSSIIPPTHSSNSAALSPRNVIYVSADMVSKTLSSNPEDKVSAIPPSSYSASYTKAPVLLRSPKALAAAPTLKPDAQHVAIHKQMPNVSTYDTPIDIPTEDVVKGLLLDIVSAIYTVQAAKDGESKPRMRKKCLKKPLSGGDVGAKQAANHHKLILAVLHPLLAPNILKLLPVTDCLSLRLVDSYWKETVDAYFRKFGITARAVTFVNPASLIQFCGKLNITTLKLAFNQAITDKYLDKLMACMQRMPRANITTFYLSPLTPIQAQNLMAFPNMSQLHLVDIQDSTYYAYDFNRLAQKQGRKLEAFTMSFSTKTFLYKDPLFQLVGSLCQFSLSELTLTNIAQLPNSISNIFILSPFLEKLTLGNINQMDNFFCARLSKLSRLRTLHLEVGQLINSGDAMSLFTLPELTELHLVHVLLENLQCFGSDISNSRGCLIPKVKSLTLTCQRDATSLTGMSYILVSQKLLHVLQTASAHGHLTHIKWIVEVPSSARRRIMVKIVDRSYMSGSVLNPVTLNGFAEQLASCMANPCMIEFILSKPQLKLTI